MILDYSWPRITTLKAVLVQSTKSILMFIKFDGVGSDGGDSHLLRIF